MGGWDNQSDRDLLLAIIAEGSLKSIDWDSVSRRMATQGYAFTKEGCRQHFMKLRRESVARGGSSASTPRKPRAPKSTKANSRGNIYDKNQAFGDGDGDDDEEDLMGESPSKRQKVKLEQKKEDDDEWSIYGQEKILFKMEDMSANGKVHIDLVNEDLYEA